MSDSLHRRGILLGVAALGLGGAPRAARAADLVQTAKDSGSFKQLVRAIELAGLAPALAGEGPFTLFAPTDEAFFKLPKAALDDILQPHNRAKLDKLLRHHVLAGLVVSRDYAGKRLEAIPLAGEALLLDARTQPRIGPARIVRSDILADNGVIHVIDTVLIPSFDDVAAPAAR
jgi:uncharacterized surface protein with fasciclin (FAS1) repeats